MEPLREQIIQTARGYLGVKYMHQGRSRNGVDCIGLVLLVAHDLNLTDFDIDHYSRVPSGMMMQRKLREHCARLAISEIQPGDVLHIAYGSQPQHLALVTDQGMIHADNIRGVVEHGLTKYWLGKVRGAYRLPGVEAWAS